MVAVNFAKAFRRHVECPDADVGGSTVGEVLDAYFADRPAARSYVLDEAGAVRPHVAVFHNSDQISDRGVVLGVESADARSGSPAVRRGTRRSLGSRNNPSYIEFCTRA